MGLDHQSSSHKRYASTSELSSSQHLRAHVSQPHLGPSLTVYDHRIIELLLSDDCALLEIVCQSTFVGDTAAVVSKGVMTLLKYRNPNLAEEFLKRIFRSRAFEYISKSRDLSDIIRDNSMATMLLNAFAKSEGYGFLSISLTAPLNGIFAHLDSCEIDPSKLRVRMPGTAESDTPNSFGVPRKPSQTTTTGSSVALSMTPLSMASVGVSGSVGLQSPVSPTSPTVKSVTSLPTVPAAASSTPLSPVSPTSTTGIPLPAGSPGSAAATTATPDASPQSMSPTTEEIVMANRHNLQLACTRLFTHIFENRRRMPASLRRMCRFLLTTVNEMAELSPPELAERFQLQITHGHPSFVKRGDTVARASQSLASGSATASTAGSAMGLAQSSISMSFSSVGISGGASSANIAGGPGMASTGGSTSFQGQGAMPSVSSTPLGQSPVGSNSNIGRRVNSGVLRPGSTSQETLDQPTSPPQQHAQSSQQQQQQQQQQQGGNSAFNAPRKLIRMLSFKKKNRVGANSSTGTVKEESGSNASINSAVATGRESGSVDGHIQGHTRESSAPVHSSLRHSDNTHDGPISPTGIPDRPQSGNSHSQSQSQSQEHHHGHGHHAHHPNGANAGSIGTKSRAHHRRMSASPSSESSSSKHTDTAQPSSGASPRSHASGLSSSATFTSPLNAYAQSPLGSHGGLGHAAAGPVDAAGGVGVPADDPPPAIVVDEPSKSTDSLSHRPVIRDLQSLGSLPVRRGVLQGSAESEGLVASSTAASMTSTTYLASRTSGTMRLASGGSAALAAPVSPSALTATSGLLGPGKSNTSVSSGATSTSMSPMSGSATGLSAGRPSVGGSGHMVSSPVRASGSMAGSSNLGLAIPPSSSSSSSSSGNTRTASFMANASSRSAGCLTQAERVVGSFLFLRFFVPAITSPETSSLLLSDKLTPARRRGLVLCGKLLTALCNDIEFGNKEDYLMYFNDYLKGYRDSMKNYIHFASSMEELSSPLTRDGFGGRSVREPESLSRQPTSKAAMTYNPSLVTAAFTAATAAISEPVDTEGEIVLDDTPQQRAAELDRQSTIIKPKQSKPVPPSEKNANGEPTPSQAADVGSLLAPPDQDPGLPRKLSSVHRKTILSQSMPALTVETNLTRRPHVHHKTGGQRNGDQSAQAANASPSSSASGNGGGGDATAASNGKPEFPSVHDMASHSKALSASAGHLQHDARGHHHASGGAGGSNSTITGAMGTLTRHGDTGGPSTTTSPIPPSVVIADLTSLFQCLVKSIDKVEREVDDRVPQWPDAKLSQSVLANFNDLKELLEHGPYSETDKTGGHSKKKATWWSRIFKIRGIFK